MDIALALIGGAACKVYDDVTDNKLIDDPLILECLKGIQWISLSLLSFNDFNFSAANYAMNITNAINNPKEWSLPYEKSLLLLYPVFLIFSFKTITYYNIYDLLVFGSIIVPTALEPYIVVEEYSFNKLLIRTIFVLCLFIGIILPVSHSVKKLVAYGIGYFMVSCVFQAYLLWT